ncbi:MAG: LysM peptidoglycan-binding domain-containing protein [Luteolibacter sp.]
MNFRILLTTVACGLLATPCVQADSEMERLRALVTEQERQIRLLEEENAQLRADATPRSAARNLQANTTNLVSAPSPSRTAASGEYTVVAGDNLVRIGRQFGISAQALAKANGLEAGSIIHPGQKLKVPTADSPAPAASASVAKPAPAATHTVQAGETFYGIARQHHVSVDRLMAANPDTQPAALRVGQKIRLPQSATATASTVAAAPAPMQQAQATSESPQPAAQATGNRRQVRTMTIDGEMSYGAFAAKHGTTPERLNQLNGLDLDARTVLAKGSELYVPAQP